MSTKLIEEKNLRTLVEYALCYEALQYEGIEKWSRYYDALESANVIRWNEEKEQYEYFIELVDQLIDMYTLDTESALENDLLNLMSLIDHKIDVYHQKDSQFAYGAESALIYVKEKLKDIIK